MLQIMNLMLCGCDEGVGVDSFAGLALLGEWHRLPLHDRLLVVLLQVFRLKRLAQGQLFGVANA